MKKIFISLALLSVIACAAIAQDNTMMSKKGLPILPEVGDWSIGISATPFIDWATDKINIMRGNNTQVSSYTAVNPQVPMTLVGMYVQDANTTYRGMVRIGFGSNTTNPVPADSLLSPSQVKVSYSAITLGAGIQKNRGKGRLRGIYGAQIQIMFGSPYDSTFSYAKALNTTTNFGTQETEMKGGSTFGLGLNGFIGVEYFFAPKMSFSAEYGWGLAMTSSGAGSETITTSNTTAVTTTTETLGKSSSFGLDVMNINSSSTGNIVFHFYF